MFRLVFLAFCAVLLLAGFQPVAAQGRRAPGDGLQPLDRILPQIHDRYPGRFYDAEGPFPDENGSPHYRLKWLTPEGRIIWLDTDARTGRVLGVTHERSRENNFGGPPPGERAPPSYYGRGRFDGDGFSPRGYDEGQRGGRGGYWNGRGDHGGDRGGWNGRGGDHGGRDGGHGGHGHHGR